jgi:hypothetical protein
VLTAVRKTTRVLYLHTVGMDNLARTIREHNLLDSIGKLHLHLHITLLHKHSY